MGLYLYQPARVSDDLMDYIIKYNDIILWQAAKKIQEWNSAQMTWEVFGFCFCFSM